MPQTQAETKEREEVLVLHNVVRRQRTRIKRAQAAGRHRFKQMVGGGQLRVVRNRPRPVPKSFVLEHIEELKKLEAQGIMEVKTPAGQLVDLETMKASPAPKPKPLPDPVKAPADLPEGQHTPVYPEGKGETEEVKAPDLTTPDLPEGKEAEEVPEELEEEVAELEEENLKDDLKAKCEELGLHVSGTKDELAVRIASFELLMENNKDPLIELAEDNGVDSKGTKAEIAARLVNEGWTPEDEG